MLATIALFLGGLVFAGCGDDDSGDNGDQEQALTSASEAAMTSADLDRMFEMFDEVCTPDTGSDECIAFMEEYCGKLDPSEDKAPKAFCDAAEFRIFGAEGPAAEKEAGEATEEPEVATPPESAAGPEQGRAVEVQILPGDRLSPVVTVNLGPKNVVAVYDERRFKPADFSGAPQVTIRRGGSTGWRLVGIVN